MEQNEKPTDEVGFFVIGMRIDFQVKADSQAIRHDRPIIGRSGKLASRLVSGGSQAVSRPTASDGLERQLIHPAN